MSATAKNFDKTLQRENRQRERLMKAAEKKPYKLYPAFLLIMIILVHTLDAYASDVISKIQSLYITEFFVIDKGLTIEEGLQQATIITFIGYGLLAVGPFYKSLMDKIGRRPIFIINTCGMAVGMLICYFSVNFYMFAAGQILISFFVMHDTQMVYVYEVAPAKWRSTLYFACKFLSVFGTLAIPLLRDVYVQEDGSGWRNVFLIPAIVGFVLFIFSAFIMRESGVFLKNRIEYLSKPEAEREKDKRNNERKSGIFPAFKYIFKNNQLKWLAISIAIFCTSMMGLTSYFETLMSTVYVTEQVTSALYFQPFAMAVMYLISGVLSDRIGRKKTIASFSALTLLGFAAFIVCVFMAAPPAVTGIMLGIYLGCFWNTTDLNGLMFAESCPTGLRGSVMGVQAIIMAAGMVFSMVLCTVLLSFFPIIYVCVIVAAPGLIAGSVLTMLKVKETKGADLDKIEYEDVNVGGKKRKENSKHNKTNDTKDAADE